MKRTPKGIYTPEFRALAEPIDLTEVGMGYVKGAAVFFLALGNNMVHLGEISAIKGLLGLVGYPENEPSPETAAA